MEEDETGRKPDEKEREAPEAKDYSPIENLLRFGLIFIAAGLIIAGITLLLMNATSEKDLAIPGGCCFGAGLISVWSFFLCVFAIQRRALNGKGVIGRKGTRHIEATVLRCVNEMAYSASYRSDGEVKKEATIVYKVTLFADGKNFTTRCKTFYYPRETVSAYINGRRAYIDENEPCNKRENIEEHYD
ncbi:MAG: hypothetical protein K2N22_05845 [Clostridia bacterium]|nr:hypothetical protein [Clostridia bacterium]